MKKILTYSLLLFFVLSASTSHAQKAAKKLSFGFGLEAGLITGDYKQLYNAAGGITVRGSYKLGPGFATLTSGAMLFVPKTLDGEDSKAGLQIPVKAGYKYIFNNHFFVIAELGFSSIRTYYEGPNGLESFTNSGFTYAPAVGVQFGSFEIGVRYESTALSGAALSAAMLRLGFNF